LQNLADQTRQLIARSTEGVQRATAVQGGTQAIGSVLSTLDQAMEQIAGNAGNIAAAATDIDGHYETLTRRLENMTGGIDESAKALEGAESRLHTVRDYSEDLMKLTALSGVSTVDTPFIELAIRQAARVSALFDAAIDRGDISLEALFDDQYGEAYEFSRKTSADAAGRGARLRYRRGLLHCYGSEGICRRSQ
jgi:methyl-accepting chemotaxis protein